MRNATNGVSCNPDRHDDAGQAFVEVALLLPLLFLLLVGGAEVGRLAYAAIEVSNAARAGVAYGAQTHATAADYNGIKQAALADAPDIASLTVSPQTLACSCQDTTGTVTSITCSSTALTACPRPSIILEDVQVNTSATFNTGFHLPGLPSSFSLQGQAIMRVEQ